MHRTMITTITTSRGGTLYLDENEHGYSNKMKKKCTTSSSKAFSRPTIYPDRSDRRRKWSSRTPVAVTKQDLRRRLISFDVIINI